MVTVRDAKHTNFVEFRKTEDMKENMRGGVGGDGWFLLLGVLASADTGKSGDSGQVRLAATTRLGSMGSDYQDNSSPSLAEPGGDWH